MNASSCLGLRFGIVIFQARATLLEVKIQERSEKLTLTLSVCFRLLFIFLLPKSFLSKSFFWFTIFCSRVFFFKFLASSQCIAPVQCPFHFEFRIWECPKSGREPVACLVPLLHLLWGYFSWQCSLGHGLRRAHPNILFLPLRCVYFAGYVYLTASFDPWYRSGNAFWLMRRDLPSFIFSCSSWARVFAAQITFSISAPARYCQLCVCQVWPAQDGIVV